MTAPYLEVKQVSKRFGDFWALRDVSLSIQPGEFVCFLGPSGCGKTTLLRIIAGLEQQDGGAIVQKGRDISGLPPSQRDFGIVFQSYALFPNLNVRDNVGYGLQGKAWLREKRQARVDELLTLVGLSASDKQYPAQLSGGMQQRVALARALATSPGPRASARRAAPVAPALRRDHHHGHARPRRGLELGRPHCGHEPRWH